MPDDARNAARLPSPCADDAVRLALKRLHRARGRALMPHDLLNSA